MPAQRQTSMWHRLPAEWTERPSLPRPAGRREQDRSPGAACLPASFRPSQCPGSCRRCRRRPYRGRFRRPMPSRSPAGACAETRYPHWSERSRASGSEAAGWRRRPHIRTAATSNRLTRLSVSTRASSCRLPVAVSAGTRVQCGLVQSHPCCSRHRGCRACRDRSTSQSQGAQSRPKSSSLRRVPFRPRGTAPSTARWTAPPTRRRHLNRRQGSGWK